MGPLGIPELLFILVLALLIFGPRKLPEIGRTLGRAMGEFRRATSDLKRTINTEIALEDESVEPSRPPASALPASPATAVAPSPEPDSDPEPQTEPQPQSDPDPDPDSGPEAVTPRLKAAAGTTARAAESATADDRPGDG